ncbi:unnamed protein product, partial [Mesorhabditis spiculigera]
MLFSRQRTLIKCVKSKLHSKLPALWSPGTIHEKNHAVGLYQEMECNYVQPTTRIFCDYYISIGILKLQMTSLPIRRKFLRCDAAAVQLEEYRKMG